MESNVTYKQKITLTFSSNPNKKIEKCQITLREQAFLVERSGTSLFCLYHFQDISTEFTSILCTFA